MEPNVKPTTKFLTRTLSTTKIVIAYNDTIELRMSHVLTVETRFYMTYLGSQWGPNLFGIRLELSFYIYINVSLIAVWNNVLKYSILSTKFK